MKKAVISPPSRAWLCTLNCSYSAYLLNLNLFAVCSRLFSDFLGQRRWWCLCFRASGAPGRVHGEGREMKCPIPECPWLRLWPILLAWGRFGGSKHQQSRGVRDGGEISAGNLVCRSGWGCSDVPPAQPLPKFGVLSRLEGTKSPPEVSLQEEELRVAVGALLLLLPVPGRGNGQKGNKSR